MLENDVQKPAGLPAEESDAQQAPAVTLSLEAKERTATLGERTFNCRYPGKGSNMVEGAQPWLGQCRESPHLPCITLQGTHRIDTRHLGGGFRETRTGRAPQETIIKFVPGP